MATFAQPKPVKPTLVNDPEAEKILKAMKAHYEGLTSYSFTFSGSVHAPNTSKNETFQGKYISNGKKFYLKNDNLLSFSDGKDLYNVNGDTKELQINDLTASKKAETPFDFIKNYDKKFKYRIKEPTKNNLATLELVPLQKNAAVFKIDLIVNTATAQPQHATLYERSGVRISYALDNHAENPKLSEYAFTYFESNFKGYEVLDLR